MSKAVEPVESGAVSVVPTEMTEADRVALRNQFDSQIANAQTLDELFEKPKPLGLEDIEGEAVTVNAVRFLKSRDEFTRNLNALGAFCVMELADGRVVTHGARTPTMVLYKIAELGGFPIKLRFHRIEGTTNDGYRPWEVERA